MKYFDLKTIEGKCGGIGSWLGNTLSSPAPGNIFYYKEHYGRHHHGNYQRGGSVNNARVKSRKYARKYKSKSKSKSKSSTTKKQRFKK
jgi:hypothetical protein